MKTGDRAETPELFVVRTERISPAMRSKIVHLCVAAHEEADFENLFAYLPGDGLHVLAMDAGQVLGHAVVTTRWLQPGTHPLLRTAYVDAVATSPRHQGRGVGTAVMSRVATTVIDYEIACLETDRPAFYERLGWVEWRGPLGGRSRDGLVPTPAQRGIMVLRLPRTPPLDVDDPLTIEATQFRIW